MARIDYSEFRHSISTSILDEWDYDESWIGNYRNVINRALILPEQEIQEPIFTIYSLLPSAVINRIGILYLIGKPGSGKSTALSIIEAVQDKQVLGASQTTFSGLRNYINETRWYDPENLQGERNTIAILDNINSDSFVDNQMLGLFLNGYDRRTDTCQISKGDGTNVTFKTFCPKVISTVHNLHSEPKLIELKRRLIPIKFSCLDTLIKNGDIDDIPDNFLEIENLDLEYLNKGFRELWEDFDVLTEYGKIKKSHPKKPQKISQENWSCSAEILFVGLTLGIWQTYNQGVFALKEYWDYVNLSVFSNSGSLLILLRQYIKEALAFYDDNDEKYLDCAELKKRVEFWAKEGKIDSNYKPSSIAEAMASLGWRQGEFKPDTEKKSDIYWLPIE